MRITSDATELSYEDIRDYTCDFSRDRFISKFTYGTVYRGRNGEKDLVVKIWDRDGYKGMDLVKDELYLLEGQKFKGRPKIISYCMDKKNPSAIVYDLNPLDTVHNLIPKDCFSWVERVKVALGFATVVGSFHGKFPPWIIRDIDAAHIFCDQDYTSILYEVGMLAGGIFGGRWRGDKRLGSYGYVDPYFAEKATCSTKTDVFAYGVVLLGLITKIQSIAEDSLTDFLDVWAAREYENKKQRDRKPSLVDQSLKSHPYFDLMDGRRITELAMECINYEPDGRPDMNEVIKVLKSLKVVRKHGNETGINMVLDRLM